MFVSITKYSNPIEAADENIKDLFYKRENRDILDFLLKTWKSNNIFRASASELIEHYFLEIK